MSSKKLSIEIEHLVGQFYSPSEDVDSTSDEGKRGLLDSDLGKFESVASVPPPYDQLLDHHKHMTVTVEAFHEQAVDVVVHRTQRDANWYSREITLVTQQDRQIVQYGIVRLNVDQLSEPVWKRIESEGTPLGRVLIEHNVLRQVQLCGLWRVSAGPSLASRMQVAIGQLLYGRTALIYCDGDPAIELLEIVSPVPPPSFSSLASEDS
ncbi:hypothetical protein Pla52o_00580 [Novipirellula galeiformis]|uniref:Uncharacterized protein n=1 Tax=Novipirellula galeiformis TaxID=2528004 RepID=A0A5C6CQJ8_9BACT|nr:hypothetical protein [Novipirellula galeiformis]TWU26205.1 hypothetical protein Pla52o_00580 [Novipirellula galeiformis]